MLFKDDKDIDIGLLSCTVPSYRAKYPGPEYVRLVFLDLPDRS